MKGSIPSSVSENKFPRCFSLGNIEIYEIILIDWVFGIGSLVLAVGQGKETRVERRLLVSMIGTIRSIHHMFTKCFSL